MGSVHSLCSVCHIQRGEVTNLGNFELLTLDNFRAIFIDFIGHFLYSLCRLRSDVVFRCKCVLCVLYIYTGNSGRRVSEWVSVRWWYIVMLAVCGVIRELIFRIGLLNSLAQLLRLVPRNSIIWRAGPILFLFWAFSLCSLSLLCSLFSRDLWSFRFPIYKCSLTVVNAS